MTAVMGRASAAILTPSPAPPHLTLNTADANHSPPTPIPNKTLPVCTPGPQPQTGLLSPPASPPKGPHDRVASLLHPPDPRTLIADTPPVYALDAATLAAAMEHMATQPLPEPNLVFPWLHGLHPDNHLQCSFFLNRKRNPRLIPSCLRGLTIVKAGGDLTCSKIKGAIAAEDVLSRLRGNNGSHHSFHAIDPRVGFSVRNFHIQACKMATVSDIVVYGDEHATAGEVHALARRMALAQRAWRAALEEDDIITDTYHTFVLTDTFDVVETNHPAIVALGSFGQLTGFVLDFVLQERREMCAMSAATPIFPGLYLAPSPDHRFTGPADRLGFAVSIEACDEAQTPDPSCFDEVRAKPYASCRSLSFPSSGSIVANHWAPELERMLSFIQALYRILRDPPARRPGDPPFRIVLHCQDGYTETSLLAVAFLMYAEGLPVHEAWIRLHKDKGRNFFAYQTDVTVLQTMQPYLLLESPARSTTSRASPEPAWLSNMDGSLPSRIMPYLYLGNLVHANNTSLLRAIGITQILSVGEPVDMTDDEREAWGEERLMFVDKVQDNGVDPLTFEFERCLQFIAQGREAGGATLVHCRVGVSRSATICIAEIMTRLGLSFPRAYCYVRARRLNVIIQPHLRFAYELLKYEEHLAIQNGRPLRRELEWATIAHDIAAMNRPYTR